MSHNPSCISPSIFPCSRSSLISASCWFGIVNRPIRLGADMHALEGRQVHVRSSLQHYLCLFQSAVLLLVTSTLPRLFCRSSKWLQFELVLLMADPTHNLVKKISSIFYILLGSEKVGIRRPCRIHVAHLFRSALTRASSLHN